MVESRINCTGYDLLGENGKDGIRYAWNYSDSKSIVESAAFIKKSKLENCENISGYTTSVSAGCILKPLGLACRFCRTGTMLPYKGMLTAYDIAKQNVFMVLTDMNCSDHRDISKNSREFAYMGQGEPGYSYVQVREAIRITDKVMRDLNQDVYRHIVATSGVPEMIAAYKDDMKNHSFESRVTMHFSLHAVQNREFIMPINKLYHHRLSLAQIEDIFDITGEKPCIGIMLFNNYIPSGYKTSYSNDFSQMQLIANELDPSKVRVSLCEFNSSPETGKSDVYTYEDSIALKSLFEERGFEVKLFSSFGREKNAACGTLGGKLPDYRAGNKWKDLELMASQLVSKYAEI